MSLAPTSAAAPAPRDKPRRGFTVVALLAVAFGLYMLFFGGTRGGVVTPYAAPVLAADPGRWLNSPPLALGNGKVTLVEIWSYG
jgi:hypothetical protein